MKLTVEKAALRDALAAAAAVVERRNTIPILSNVLLVAGISDGEGRLTVTGSDHDMEVSFPVPAQVAVEGAVTVSAQTIADVIREQEDGAQVELVLEDGRLKVAAGRSRFRLHTLPSDDFPRIAVGEAMSRFEIPADDLRKAIARIAFAQCTEESRWYLNGVLLEANGSFAATATDGTVLATVALPVPEGAESIDRPILGRKMIGIMARLLDGEDGRVGVELMPGKVRWRIGQVILTGKLIEGTFPDWQRVVPSCNDRVLRVETSSLERALRRVTSVSTDKARAVKWSLDKDRLTLSVASPEHGDAAEEIPCDWASGSFEVGFNARFVLDTLKAHGGAQVHVALADPTAPALFTNPADEAARWVVMPLRV